MLVLCILFGVRSIFKFLAVTVLTTSIGAHMLMLADFFVFCSMLDNGLMVRPPRPLPSARPRLPRSPPPRVCARRTSARPLTRAQANSADVFSGAATQVVLVLVCALTATLIFTYQQCHPTPAAVVAAAHEVPDPRTTSVN